MRRPARATSIAALLLALAAQVTGTPALAGEPRPRSPCQGGDHRATQRQEDRDLLGLYRETLAIAPEGRVFFDGNTQVTNYMAIVLNEDGTLRLRLKTSERNGHDCEIDTSVEVCGAQLVLVPSQEEAAVLSTYHLATPRLSVSPTFIEFAADSSGTFHFGPPFCGSMGHLNHRFPRSSKQADVPESAFN